MSTKELERLAGCSIASKVQMFLLGDAIYSRLADDRWHRCDD